MSVTELETLKNACGALLIGGELAGTAYLVDASRLATCAHVVRSVGTGGRVEVLMPEGLFAGTVESLDEATDSALVKLDKKAGARPLARGKGAAPGGRWIAYGFPRIAMLPGKTQPVGVVAEGTVIDPSALDPKNTASLQLYSEMFAAGRGAIPHGFSGSPVLVRGQLVGHLKRILLDLTPPPPTSPTPQIGSSPPPPPRSRRAEMGIVYACPVREVERLGGLTGMAPRRKPLPPGAPYDRPWYIHRGNEEKLALAHLDNAGAPVVIGGPDGVGKSMFLGYLLDEMRQRDEMEERTTRTCTLRMTLLTGTKTTIEELLANVARQIIAELGGSQEWVDELENEPIPWPMKLSDLLEERILTQPADRFVIVVEHADEVWGKPYQSDFYGMLRDWSERGHSEPWSRLRLLLALSTTPALLIQAPGGLRSPWNLAAPIELPDFRADQILALADQYDLAISEDDAKSTILKILGGHPLLVSKLFYTARVLDRDPLDLLRDPDSLEDLFGDHLTSVLLSLERDGALKDALQAVLTSPDPRIDAVIYERLKKAGIVSRRGGRLSIRYPIYENHIREQWSLRRTL